jgi:hypothetical protein
VRYPLKRCRPFTDSFRRRPVAGLARSIIQQLPTVPSHRSTHVQIPGEVNRRLEWNWDVHTAPIGMSLCAHIFTGARGPHWPGQSIGAGNESSSKQSLCRQVERHPQGIYEISWRSPSRSTRRDCQVRTPDHGQLADFPNPGNADGIKISQLVLGSRKRLAQPSRFARGLWPAG